MKRFLYVFSALILILLTACFPSKSVFEINTISLSTEEKAVKIDVDIEHSTLNVSITDIFEYGIIIINKEINDIAELTFATKDQQIIADELSTNSFTSFITDIKDFAINYTARPYIKAYIDGQEEIIYSDDFTVFNLYDLAKESEGEYAQKIITVIEADSINEVKITYDGTKATALTSNIEVSILENNLIFKVVPNEGYYFVNDTSLIFNELEINEKNYIVNYNEIIYQLNLNDNINILVDFDLNGGKWTKDIMVYINPEIIINADFNDDFFLTEEKLLDYNNYYKIFLKEYPAQGLLKIIGFDNAAKRIDSFNINYDFILLINESHEDTKLVSTILDYFSHANIGNWVYITNDEVSFYEENVVENNISNYLYLATTLPNAYKEDHVFIGWSDGNKIYNEFPGYKIADNVFNINYKAVWEPFAFSYFIPDELTDDIYLPDSVNNYPIFWESSHPEILATNGKYNKPYQDTTILLEAEITLPHETVTESFEIFARGYKKLDAPIASSYIYRNYYLVDDEFFDTLDIINTAFIHADSNGNLSGTTYLNNVESTILPRAKERGTWVIMSIAPESQWSTIASDENRIEHFANNIVEMINEYGFDGVDIDWETPKDSEKENFTSLMKVVYEKVKTNNPHHLVTAAITGGMWQPPRYDLLNSGKYIDYINMMTYGMTSSNGQYQNPLYKSTLPHNQEHNVGSTLTSATIEESIQIFKNDFNIPYSKIIVGIAFYGIRQEKVNNSWIKSGSIYYSSILNLVNNSDYTFYYDENAGVPYVLKNDGTVFISYDNERSILEKSNFIIDNQIGGIMFWEYGTDTTGNLLRAIKEGLNK